MPKIPTAAAEKPVTTANPEAPAAATTAAPPKAKPPKVTPMPAPNSSVVHPKLSAVAHTVATGNPITVEYAKELLGWTEEMPQSDASPGTKFGDAYLLTDERDVKVRCLNNTRNRPFEDSWSRRLAQDILNRHWLLNGESIIVGKSGQVLSGQHRLIALVLAYQLWSGDRQKHHWSEKWETEPVLESVVVFGVDEGSATTRTLDNVKPRTFADVLFTETGFFGKAKPGERKLLARMVDYAVKLLWHRTGEKKDAYSPHRTHSEGLEYIDRHKKILACVKHISEENVENAITKYISPGTAAGCMYLMAASKTDGDTYRLQDSRSEKKINMDGYDKAEEFWTLLGSGAPDFKHVRQALKPVTDTGEAVVVSQEERLAILAKAWAAFFTSGKVRPSDVEIQKTTNDEGDSVLMEVPDFGGIDLGDPKAEDSEIADGEAPASEQEEPPAETKAEIEARKKKLTEEQAAKVAAHNEKVKNGNGKPHVADLPIKAAKAGTRKDVESKQTEKARKADAELASAGK